MLRSFPLLIFLLFLVFSCTTSKEIIQSSTDQLSIYQSSKTKSYDLLHMDLDLNLNEKVKTLTGTAILKIKPYFYAIDSLVLDAQYMDIFNVSTLDSALRFSYEYDSTRLTVYFNQTLTRTDTFQLKIIYQANPEKVKGVTGEAITDAKGLYFIDADSTSGSPAHIWTQGETKSSSCWFPTNDVPNEKLTHQITIHTDTSNTTVSNGRLISSTTDDATKTDIWLQDQAHSPYLVMLFVGPFNAVNDIWINSTGDTIPLQYLTEDKWRPSNYEVFKHTPEMLSFFSEKMAYEYPWPKYDQIVVSDFVSGAMENTTASVFYDGLNVTDKDLLDKHHDDIIAHELFHHWFGNLVTCESWSNLPLNESFATYGEYLWFEHKYGRDEADWHLQFDLWNYLEEAVTGEKELIRFYYEERDDMFDAHSYQKGGRVLHLLRSIIGDEAFFKSLKLYLHKYEFGTAEIHDLRMAFEEVTGQDLNWFFNQWFMSKGHPHVSLNYEKQNHKHWDLNFSQSAESSLFFTLPIDIEVHTLLGKETKRLHLDSNHLIFSIKSDTIITWINIDPGKQQLWQIKEHKTFEEWKLQYQSADLAIDRYWALEQIDAAQASEVDAINVMLLALEDDFHVNRKYALSNANFNSKYEDAEFVEKIKSIALNDPNSAVRSAAIDRLVKVNSLIKYPELETFAIDKMKDSSYLVKSSALNCLGRINNVEALKYAEPHLKTNHVELSFALANIIAKSKATDTKYVDFYIHHINNAYKYYSISYFYYFSQFIRKPAFQNLVELNRVFDFVLDYQNKNYESAYTRYMTGQMMTGLKQQYDLLLKDLSINDADRSSINTNLNKIEAVIKAVKKRT